ncbi:EamA family transporter [Teichococcus aestuarii]
MRSSFTSVRRGYRRAGRGAEARGAHRCAGGAAIRIRHPSVALQPRRGCLTWEALPPEPAHAPLDRHHADRRPAADLAHRAPAEAARAAFGQWRGGGALSLRRAGGGAAAGPLRPADGACAARPHPALPGLCRAGRAAADPRHQPADPLLRRARLRRRHRLCQDRGGAGRHPGAGAAGRAALAAGLARHRGGGRRGALPLAGRQGDGRRHPAARHHPAGGAVRARRRRLLRADLHLHQERQPGAAAPGPDPARPRHAGRRQHPANGDAGAGWRCASRRRCAPCSARRTSAQVGALSACGSACWFSGFALAPVAMVRALGQTEILFTLLFSRFYLRETLKRSEVAGALIVVLGVVLVLVGR